MLCLVRIPEGADTDILHAEGVAGDAGGTGSRDLWKSGEGPRPQGGGRGVSRGVALTAQVSV